MPRRLSRRAFLAGVAAAAAAGCRGGGRQAGGGTAGPGGTTTSTPPATGSTTTTPATVVPADAPPELPEDIAAVEIATDPFTLGVASGDPDPTSVVLWTRLAPDPFTAGAGLPPEIPGIAVQVADDDTFTSGVRTVRAEVDAKRGHSVHVVVDGLAPATTYRYRFRIGRWTSPVGTTRTTPAPGDAGGAPLRLAVASCQRYDHGAFAAHADIAAADVDLVVFVGDYVYEAATGPRAVRPLPGPRGDVAATDLTGYRDRYVAARLDPALAAAHAAAPWVLTWDDHEVADSPTGHHVAPERRAAAYQAWWEHSPVRLPPPPLDGGEPYPIDRVVRWGALADLVVLDARQFRAAPACGGGLVHAASCAAVDDPARSMLGPEQTARLRAALAEGAPAWTLLANSVVLADVELLGRVNADAWDGFRAARAELLADLAAAGRADTVALTGDIHVAVVADVTDATGAVVATELVTPSISSRIADTYAGAVPFLPVVARNVVHAADHRGWLRCELDGDELRATYRRVVDPADPDSAVVDAASFVVRRGTPGARPA